jgi:hypothetical protein
MIFDPEQVRADAQRSVFLATIQTIKTLGEQSRAGGPGPRLELAATIDGLLEVIAALLVEARALPDGFAEQELCEDAGQALLHHIHQTMREQSAEGPHLRH